MTSPTNPNSSPELTEVERVEGLIDNLVYAIADPDFSHEERTERREKLSAAIQALSSKNELPSATMNSSPITDEMFAFLLGEAALDAKWFGERYDGVARYWWRKHLRAMRSSAPSVMTQDLVELLRGRKDQSFDGECHLTNEEADRIVEALSNTQVTRGDTA
jgi:hypothetical protein